MDDVERTAAFQGQDKPDDSLEAHGVVSRPRSLLSNASWSVFSTLWSVGVLFLLTPFLITRLGETHYGVYILLASVSGIFGMMNLGLGEASLRFVAYYYGRRDVAGMNRVFQATLFVYLIMAAVGAATLVFSAHLIVPIFELSPVDEAMAVALARWTSLAFASGMIAGSFGAIPQALQRFDVFAKVTMAGSFFRVAGFVPLLLLGYGLWGVVLWNLVTSVFLLLIDVIVARRLMPKLQVFALPTRSALHEVFGYGVYSFLTQLVGMVWQYADRLLVGVFAGVQSVTWLSVPKDVAMKGLMISGSAGNILMPRFSGLSDLEQTRRLFARSTSALLCLTIVIFGPFTVVMYDFLSLWISPELARRGAFVGQLVAVSSMARGAFQPYMALFRGLGHPKYVLWVTLLSSATIISCNVVLIPWIGLSGAGYSYCLSSIWGFAAIVFAWRYLLGLRDLVGLARMVLVPLGLGSACVAGGFVLRNAWSKQMDWFGFIGFASIVTGGTAAVVLGYDYYVGRRQSIVGLLAERLGRFGPPKVREL